MTLDYISRNATTLNIVSLMNDRLSMVDQQTCLDRHSYYTIYYRYIYIIRGTRSYSPRVDKPNLRSHEYVSKGHLSNNCAIQDTLYARSKHK